MRFQVLSEPEKCGSNRTFGVQRDYLHLTRYVGDLDEFKALQSAYRSPST